MSRTKRLVPAVLIACISTVLPCTSTRAQVDLTGSFTSIVQSFVTEVCGLTIVQTGTTIELEQICGFAPDGVGTGTIDPNTGVFSATGTCGFGAPVGDSWTITGTASPDSYRISGGFMCGIFTLAYSASRCGNGVLDPGEDCDDGNLLDGDDCTATCEVCRVAKRSILIVKDREDDRYDWLVWKWLKGEETMQCDFGVPTGTAVQTLSVYYAGIRTLVAQVEIPADAGKWSPIGDRGWKYKDKVGGVDGIRKIILNGGAPGQAKIVVRGKGLHLPDLPAVVVPRDNAYFPIRVELRNSATDLCWHSIFDKDDIEKGSPILKLKARN